MPARKQLWHHEDVRLKIKASQLINRLTNHALADAPGIMEASQVAAAKAVLAKVLPDLQAVQVSGDQNNPLRVAQTRRLDITGLNRDQLDVLEGALAQTVLAIEHRPEEPIEDEDAESA